MDVKQVLKIEKRLYFKNNKEYLKEILFNSNTYNIWIWQIALRKEEYYSKKKNFIAMLLLVYWRNRKNRLGRKLGFDIPGGVFSVGLRIWHISSVVVNPFARVGKNAVIVGDLCIGNNDGKRIAAYIGDNCIFGWGSAVIGDIKIANNCKIGAGAIVVKDVIDDNSVLVGVPAKNIRK